MEHVQWLLLVFLLGEQLSFLKMTATASSRLRERYYGAIIPSALTVFSMQGFLILNCIIGGQTLASVSGGHLDDTLGIVIIGLISLAVGDTPQSVLPRSSPDFR